MRLYNFLNAEHALDDIRKKRIKISLIPDLNDPFELWTFPLLKPQHRKVWQTTIQEIGKKFGVICLSRRWSNPLLWSHYADKHYGICLGFEVDDDIVEDIKYRKSKLPYSLDLNKPNVGLSEEKMKKILYTKYLSWKYEDEIRVQANLESSEPHPENPSKLIYFKDFDSQFKLRKVIVGVRSEVTKVQIQEALQDYLYDVEIIKARLAFRTFRVIRNRRGFVRYSIPNQRQLFRL